MALEVESRILAQSDCDTNIPQHSLHEPEDLPSLEGQNEQNVSTSINAGPDEGEVGFSGISVDYQEINANASVPLKPLATAPLQAPREWKSVWLKFYVLIPMAVITFTLASVIVVLSILSAHNQGFATVSLANKQDVLQIGDFELDISLTWAFFPVFVLQIYMLMIGAIVKAASTRQPFIELRRCNGKFGGALAQSSIYLDYDVLPAAVAPLKALKNRHFLLAYSFGVSLLANIVLTALTAYLFYTITIEQAVPREMEQRLDFNDSYFPTEGELESIYSYVLGSRVYGGPSLPWTTLNESVLPFSLEQVPVTTNLTAWTQVYTASLDCKVLDPMYEFELLRTATGWRFSIADRGCELTNQYFSTPAGLGNEFLETFVNSSCGLEARLARIVVIAASLPNPPSQESEPTELSNKTAVSCIPKYSRSEGWLSVSVDEIQTQHPVIQSFQPVVEVGPSTPDPEFANLFYLNLNVHPVLGTTPGLFSTEFGNVIYNYAETLAPEYFAGQTLQRATQDIFKSLFAVMASTVLVRSSATQLIHATLTRHETRVVIVQPVAYVIIALLILLLFALAWIYHYSSTHPSILYEEPGGILGMAAVLKNSELIDRVQAIQAGQCEGKVAVEFKRQSEKDNIPERWTFENWDRPDEARLCSIGLVDQHQ